MLTIMRLSSNEAEPKVLKYRIGVNSPSPQKGEYLVFLGKKGVNQVCIITDVVKLRHKKDSPSQGYSLTLIKKNHLIELTEYELLENGFAIAWVKGEQAHPCFWA